MTSQKERREALDALGQSESAARPRLPWRDRVYGKLKVSVRAMDTIIYTAVGLLALVLLLGILTAGK
jgi:hypothetical protein